MIIPKEFDETYQNYNKIQTDQGLDLTRYRGKRCRRYSYMVHNHPSGDKHVRLNLLVCSGKIIGGMSARWGLTASCRGWLFLLPPLLQRRRAPRPLPERRALTAGRPPEDDPCSAAPHSKTSRQRAAHSGKSWRRRRPDAPPAVFGTKKQLTFPLRHYIIIWHCGGICPAVIDGSVSKWS